MNSWTWASQTQATNVLTVTQLNQAVKRLLEAHYAQVRVCGEVSNLIHASSGHAYFTLKDPSAQIRCALFKTQQRPNSPPLKNGMQIILIGKLSLFEPRGDYQLIVQAYEDAGLGQLHQAFEALKQKLLAEGLFDASRKRTLPTHPQKIAIITSPKGAALRDMLITLYHRYPLVEIKIFPCEVQGVGAPEQIIQALQAAYQHTDLDVILLARGGGSLEDLWAFNHERLARMLAESPYPVVTGIGHETDFTIADFVADVRAATPTAAAALITPHQTQLKQQLNHTLAYLYDAMAHRLLQLKQTLSFLNSKIQSALPQLTQQNQLLDYLERQLQQTILQQIQSYDYQILKLMHRLMHSSLPATLPSLIHQQKNLGHRLIQAIQHRKIQDTHRLGLLAQSLNAMSPLATLQRGYAIVSQGQHLITHPQHINRSEPLSIQLAEGSLTMKVYELLDAEDKRIG